MYLTRVNGRPTSDSDRCLVEQMIELFPDNRYMLGDQMCKGFFTGDDFCVVSISHSTFRSLSRSACLRARSKAADVYCHNFPHLSFALLSIPLLVQDLYLVQQRDTLVYPPSSISRAVCLPAGGRRRDRWIGGPRPWFGCRPNLRRALTVM